MHFSILGTQNLKGLDRFLLPSPLVASFLGNVFSGHVNFRKKHFCREDIGATFMFPAEDLRAAW